MRTQGGQLPLPLRTFRASLALSQKQVFSAVLPLFPRCARGSTKRKRSLLQIVALLCRGARAMPCGPAPALSAPAGGRRGVLLWPSASHPCGLCARAALRAALRHRRPIGAPCRRSARASVARRPAARLVALPSAPPRRRSVPARPAAFAPSMMDSRPVSSRVWGCSASFRASARCARSRSGLVPGGLVSRGAPPSSSRGVGGSRAGQVAAARCLSVQRVTRRPARGQEAARRGGVGDSVPGAAAAAPWPSCAPWQGVGTLHPPRRFALGGGGYGW